MQALKSYEKQTPDEGLGAGVSLHYLEIPTCSVIIIRRFVYRRTRQMSNNGQSHGLLRSALPHAMSGICMVKLEPRDSNDCLKPRATIRTEISRRSGCN